MWISRLCTGTVLNWVAIKLNTFCQHRTNASIEKQIVSNEDVPLMKMLKAFEWHYVHSIHYTTIVLWH